MERAKEMKTILAIESTCDDSCAAVVGYDSDADGTPRAPRVIADVRASQWHAHAPFGGVVPTLAVREHEKNLPLVVRDAVEACAKATGGRKPDLVAVASEPGMRACVDVGKRVAADVAGKLGVPLRFVNHLHAHALVARLVRPALAFPFLTLLVSGGHSIAMVSQNASTHRVLGSTTDDALGEAFDKVARALGTKRPDVAEQLRTQHGGAVLERLARAGKRNDAVRLPVPMRKRPEHAASMNFSFAGLKTASFRLVEAVGGAVPAEDIALEFQTRAFDHVMDVVRKSVAHEVRSGRETPRSLVVCGGVAANAELRARLEAVCVELGGMELSAPPRDLCVDNAVMIAHAAAEVEELQRPSEWFGRDRDRRESESPVRLRLSP